MNWAVLFWRAIVGPWFGEFFARRSSSALTFENLEFDFDAEPNRGLEAMEHVESLLELMRQSGRHGQWPTVAMSLRCILVLLNHINERGWLYPPGINPMHGPLTSHIGPGSSMPSGIVVGEVARNSWTNDVEGYAREVGLPVAPMVGLATWIMNGGDERLAWERRLSEYIIATSAIWPSRVGLYDPTSGQSSVVFALLWKSLFAEDHRAVGYPKRSPYGGAITREDARSLARDFASFLRPYAGVDVDGSTAVEIFDAVEEVNAGADAHYVPPVGSAISFGDVMWRLYDLAHHYRLAIREQQRIPRTPIPGGTIGIVDDEETIGRLWKDATRVHSPDVRVPFWMIATEWAIEHLNRLTPRTRPRFSLYVGDMDLDLAWQILFEMNRQRRETVLAELETGVRASARVFRFTTEEPAPMRFICKRVLAI